MEREYDLLVIGAGQAGLAAGYYAEKKQLRYLIVDGVNRIGDSWRNRYDSLTLFTPRAYNNLPGLPLAGNKDDYPTKDELAQYLEEYAAHFKLNIQLNTRVVKLAKQDTVFIAKTDTSSLTAKAVIIATGPFQAPYTPEWRKKIEGALQLHSSEYRNSDQIAGEKVLIVGGGNSGVQIAEEINQRHKVTLAVNSSLRFLPTRIAGRSTFWWLDKLGILHSPKESLRAKLLKNHNEPIVGTSIKPLINSGEVLMKPAAVSAKENMVTFADGSFGTFDTIIWCTGYRPDYGFIALPDALNTDGAPFHSAGISTTIDNLGFLGLKWLRSRGSSLVGGVGKDAEAIMNDLFP